MEGLLLLKLYALPALYRMGNFSRVGIYENDVATLIHDYSPDASGLVSKLEPYLSEGDFAEVQGILSEIESRVARFRSRERS